MYTTLHSFAGYEPCGVGYVNLALLWKCTVTCTNSGYQNVFAWPGHKATCVASPSARPADY